MLEILEMLKIYKILKITRILRVPYIVRVSCFICLILLKIGLVVGAGNWLDFSLRSYFLSCALAF